MKTGLLAFRDSLCVAKPSEKVAETRESLHSKFRIFPFRGDPRLETFRSPLRGDRTRAVWRNLSDFLSGVEVFASSYARIVQLTPTANWSRSLRKIGFDLLNTVGRYLDVDHHLNGKGARREMRKSKEEASKTRRHIVSTAAAEFRRSGIEGTGLADVMATAGLTHGGFYRHFDAKNQLVAEVCAEALRNMASTMRAVVSGKPKANALKAAADKYLSASHRADRAHGCPLVALGSEIARCDGTVRAAATQGILQMAQALADGLIDERPNRAKHRALVALSAMVGALALARIVDDPALSNRILQETRRHVATV